ncbi:hypothetical protein H310_11342 [Aphanomyces invadans]|uniref:Uncharacterized protein n=1 Tax=Aphanomyces invadans TaxID=157072 RepID=A0A024TLK8_9STRA|nr:hypothetical protein H310_11342 [Aphanomyces invadans]ETV95040.1 hypothetical protein H310_11342 [Aphanomyces invadans]|eukprot:XP_008876213.1 hypothetical protein H310_11342 [Aphanomyces invadans]
MNRKIGFDNRLCYQREVARCQKIHQDKLRHIQPTSLSPAKGKLDNTAPQQHAHLKANFKKAQMDSDKYKQIYGENQQLMRKMLKICDAAPSDAAVEFRPGMRLNTDQTPLLDSYVSVQSLTRGCAIDKGSMNGEFRQRQNDKIEEENRKLMHRLMTKKSCYSARKWDAEYKQSLRKFKHVHQDATVGYLSPKSRAVTACAAAASTLPSLGNPHPDAATDSAENTSPPLSPSPPPPCGHMDGGGRARSTTGCTHRSSAFIRQASKTQVPPSRKQTYRTKCVPVLLLEATTSMGVHFTVEELQVAMVTPSATRLGDLGFLLRAKKDANEGESVVPLKGLVDVAQSLPPADGRPILAKLATIEAIPNVGNFPRVSQTLDESDLKLVLVKLVQCIRVSSIHGATDAAASLKLTVEHIEHLRRDLQPAAGKLTVANSSILDLIAQGMVPPRFVLRGKRATIHLCHARVFQLRRLLTFHAFDVRTHNVVNFQFTEEDLLPHFHISPLWPDIYRTLFKLAMKRIRI